MLNFNIKFSFGGIYRIWDEIRIESISNLRQWITNDYNSNWQIIYKKDNEQSFIYQWKDNIIKVLIYPLCILESYDESSMGMIKAINFPNEYIDDTDKINISFPLLFLSKIINRNEEYEKRYKESIIFDLEKQEILSRKNYPLFSILTTNQEFLFCLSPDLKKLECFDIFQGQHEVWDFDFEAEGYGVLKNEPPAQYLDMLLFMVRGKESPSTLAIDSQTGKKRWYCEMGHLPNVSCTYNGNLVSYRGIWYNDVVYINPQTGEITEHWYLPDWVNDYPLDDRGNFTIDEQYLYLAPKNYVGLDHEYYEGKGVLVFSLETHELVQELPCQINMQCKKIEKVGKRLFVHDHGNLHIFVEEDNKKTEDN